MASISVLRAASSYKNLLLNRFLFPTLQCSCVNHYKYSTATNPMEGPIKYTTSKASQMKMSESLQLNAEPRLSSRTTITLSICMTVVLFYIAFFREENDIDEFLKGNPEFQNDYIQLQNLKFQLLYCKENNMSTEKIERKISEIHKKLGIPNPYV